ncbi:CDP-alcohol phosphatidyltransferase family protein [Streptomonospora litoralis]|uniref:CDP-alcohol phosphatidyltransferase family protein n=1 Tax=Streptomonospora litoralis TaxID=2498135 RepID=UPI001F61F2A7|nr:CDP-alcohol phosphatidyltransferase family protein [Streptomonospora litoralis]
MSRPPAAAAARAALRDAQTPAALGALALLAALTPAAGLGAAGWTTGAVCVAGTWTAYTAARGRRGQSPVRPADAVTLARAALIASVAALVAEGLTAGEPVSSGILVVLAVLALVLDAVDGAVARRTGTASELGARLDMEADALLILVLSLHVGAALGWWAVAIGAMRYVFAAAGRFVPRLRAPLPPSDARRFVAALQGIALTAAASTLLPVPVATAAVAAALGLLVWSFGRDTLWLLRDGGSGRHYGHRADRRTARDDRATGG